MREGARAFLASLLVVIPLAAAIFVPGYLDPTLTWRGRAAPELTKWVHVVAWALLAWAFVWSVVQYVYCSGRVSVLQVRTDRDGVVWAGTWLDHHAALWRRLRCVGDFTLDVRTNPGSRSGGAFDHTYLVLASRGRTRKIHLLTPVDTEAARDLERWVRDRARAHEGGVVDRWKVWHSQSGPSRARASCGPSCWRGARSVTRPTWRGATNP